MRSSIIVVGRSIEITSNEGNIWSEAIIKSIKNDLILINFPILQSSYESRPAEVRMLFEVGDEIQAKIVNEDKIYIFDSKILDIIKNSFLLQYPADIFILQRRAYERVGTNIPLEYEIQNERKLGTAVELSGGGMISASKDKMVRGERILLEFSLPGVDNDNSESKFKLLGQVMGTRKVEFPFSMLNCNGIKFLDISNNQSEIINSYVVKLIKNKVRD